MLTAKIRRVEKSSNGFVSQVPRDFVVRDAGGLGKLEPSKAYPRGSVLFAEGQQPLGVYRLCEGRAKVSIGSADGKTLVLRIASPGELLGVDAVLSGEPYDATVETLGNCRVDFISRADLWKLLNKDKKACLGVAHSLGHTLSRVVEHSRLLLLSQSAAEKLARLLIRWCDEHGERTPHGIQIKSGLTHEELAEMICASRETVTRVLGELKRKHIISLLGNAIYIRNRKALELVARC